MVEKGRDGEEKGIDGGIREGWGERGMDKGGWGGKRDG